MDGIKTLFVIGIMFLLLANVMIMISGNDSDVINTDHNSKENVIRAENSFYSGPVWPMYQFDQRRTGQSPFNATGNPGRVKLVMDGIISDFFNRWIIIDDEGNLYCSDPQSNLCCYFQNGTIKWKAMGYGSSFQPIFFKGILYLYNGKLVALYSSNGSVFWNSSKLEKSQIVLDENNLIIYCIHGNHISAFDLNGNRKWTVKYDNVNCQKCSQIALSDSGTLYFNYAYWEGIEEFFKFISINSNGTVKWSKNIPVPGITHVMIDSNDTVYIITKNIEAYYPNGTLKWSINIDNEFKLPPSLCPDETIIVYGDKLYAINPNGTIKWNRNYIVMSNTITVDSDGNILFNGRLSTDNDITYLIMLNTEGILQWKLNIRSPEGSFGPIISPNGNILSLDFYQPTDSISLFVIGKTPPDTPMLNSSKSGDSYVNISWSLPEHDGGEPIIEYRVYRSEGKSSMFEQIASVSPEVRWYLDEGLVNGVEYHYKVSAVNVIGESDLSLSVSAIPLARPKPPVDFNCTFGDYYVFISWGSPLDDGGSDVTSYLLYRGLDPGSFSVYIELDSWRRNYNDTDVEPGVVYYYMITALNSVGESDPTDVRYGSPKTIPGGPSNISIKSGNGYVHLSWSYPLFDGGSPIVNYTLYRSVFSSEVVNMYVFSSEVNEYNDTDVMNGEQYSYIIRASNAVGMSQNSDELIGRPVGPPSPPLNLSVLGGDGYVDLSWNEPENDGGHEIVGYVIERKSGNDIDLISILSSAHVYRDNEVENGVVYLYRILSYNEAGNSSFTAYVEVVPRGVPSEPLGLSIDVGRYFAFLSWFSPENDGGSSVTFYRIYRNGTFLDEVSGNVNYYNDTNVSCGCTYSYFVTAMNVVGESIWSQSVHVTIPREPAVMEEVPSAPRDLSVVAENLSVTLTWLPPASDGNSSIRNYIIYRGSGGIYEPINMVEGNVLIYVDDSVEEDVSYSYYVTAKNVVGEGPGSNVVTLKIEIESEGVSKGKSGMFLYVIATLVVILLLVVIGGYLILKSRRRRDSFKEE